MGLMKNIAPWRKWRRDAKSTSVQGPHEAKTEAWRICRFEQVEERCPLAADIHLGAVYEDPASGAKTIPNTFTISWSGGAPGTELKQLMISTDLNGDPTVQVGDPFFDTAPGSPGVYGYSPLAIVSHDGFQVTAQSPAQGSTELVLNFSGFTPGKQLALTIDVEDLDTNGVNATVNGHEFEGARMIGTFSAPHYADDTLTGTFYDMYQSALDNSGLSLPPDDYIGGLIGGKTVNTVPSPVYTAGAFAASQQTPLPITLAGTVYYDPDLDNVQEQGEPGLSSVQLSLLQNNGTAYVPTGATTITDANGHYAFTNVLPGDYEIVETQPTGYLPVGSSAGNVNGVTYGVVTDAHTLSKIVVLGGEDVVHNDFSQSLPNSISGTVRVAPTGTGEPSDAPKGGVPITLVDKNGNQVASTTSASDGTYSFTNLAPGTYTVKEGVPTGYYAINDVVGSQGGTALDLTTLGNIVLTSDEKGVRYDFYLQQPVTLAGTVLVSPQGTHDANSTPLGGVTIQLRDSAGNVLATTTTADDGSYRFPAGSILKPGTYSVHELVPGGYYATYDAVGNFGGTTADLETLGNITLTSGQNGIQYNFWLQRPVTVAGTVRVSPLGTHDANSTPLGGVTVQLLDGQGHLLETTTTADDGSYRFPSSDSPLLKPGTYTVHELLPAGYYATYDAIGSNGGTASDLQTLANLTLISGQAGVKYDFWLQQPVGVSGYVHSDINGCWTPTQNLDAPPVAGVTIQLLDAGGKVIGTTITDANGYYQFQTLPPGTYSVQELLPTGWFSGPSHVGSAGGNSANDELLTAITLTSGTNGVYYDFCLTPPATISGYVHSDINGCWTPTENQNDPPVAGVTIQLLDLNGNVLGTTTSDANGFYKFANLIPGTYSVRELLPAGWFAGPSHVGTEGGTSASDELLSTVPLAGGANGLYYDFCLTPPASISGYVHSDIYGCWTPTENQPDPPVAGVTVQLLDSLGDVLATTTTDANGFYKFANLTPGAYNVLEILPPGWFAGASHVGTVGGDDTSDVLLANVNLPAGIDALYYDFCLTPPAQISGYVHSDIFGCWTPTENQPDPPIAGVTILLLDANSNLVATTTTDANGFYKFANLMPGAYSVQEIMPSGWYTGASHVGSVGGTSATSELISDVTLGAGANGLYYDFCLTPPGSLSGYVHSDVYGCWTPTENQPDPPVAGVSIRLLDANGNVLATTTTDANGFYLFDGLAPGDYSVQETLPAGWYAGAAHVGSLGGDSIAPTNISAVPLAAGNDGVYYDFCLTPPGKISGYVFIDGPPIATHDPAADVQSVLANLPHIRSGIRQPGDAPVPGVTLTLADATGTPLLDQLGNRIQVTTDANGYYQFTGLPPGLYTVVKDHPTGYIDGLNVAGTLGGQAISPTLIQVGAQSVGVSISSALLQAVGPVNGAIAGIPLGNGQESQNNNFSEITLTTESPPIPIPPPLITPAVAIPVAGPDSPNQPPAPPVAAPPGSPFLSGSWGVSGVTWHLSVVDAGLPRASVAALRSAAQLARMRADVAAWFGARLRHGLWKLHPHKGTAADAKHVVFGKLGGIPITGDFNGDGVTDVGVYVKGEWFIDLNGNGIWDDADLWAKLGTADDRPVTGDWDGDGKTDIGIFGPAWAGDPRAVAAEPGLPDPYNQPTGAKKNVPPQPHQATIGQRELKRTRGGTLRADLIDHVFHFGQQGDVPITGDWSGTGVDSIGIFNGGQWILDVDGDGKRSEQDITLKLGEGGDKPVVGDFDGDGVDELGVYREGHWHIDINHDGALDERDLHHELGDGSHTPVVGDWDGDGVDQVGVHQEQPDVRGDI